MKKIVVKFGGSNLKDKSGLEKVINRINEYNQPLVIVVSAFYGITDLLSEALTIVLSSDKKIENLTKSLSEMKQKIINEFFPKSEIRDKVQDEISKMLKKLERYLFGIHYIGDVPSFVEDIVLSYGERMSSYILSEILSYRDLDCELVLPEDMGFYTDGDFGNATIDFEKSTDSVRKKLSDNKIFVVPGFYGISREGKITLLGRGGSDYSAGAIAKCIDAKSLDIWKDVNGFLSADPKIIPQAKQIKKLDYIEVAELSYFGAKVLHPRTIEPLIEANIPIRIFNINDNKSKMEPFSVIDGESEVSKGTIKSVTYSNDFCVLKLNGAGVGMKPGILAKVTNDFDNFNINIKTVITAQTSINFLLAKNDLKRAYDHTKKMKLTAVSEIVPIENITVVALVGNGLSENHSIAGKIFGALAKKRINIKIINSGASEVAIYFVIDSKDTEVTITAIHQEFFE
ncbi:MAG: aspartate kinase [Candidatus Marinimicrobia bacterium]|nr:aspartate kinase [Candidatus Neomarinimicrobiota bacterium]